MMTNLSTEKFPASSAFYLVARTLERGGYYGIRSLLVMYMTQVFRDLSHSDVSMVYGLFIGGTYLSNVIGALFGDLLIGNRTAMIVGSAMQLAAALMLCIPTGPTILVGVGLLALGTGFVNTNLTAQFGKQFSNSPKFLDGAMTAWYTVINIGALVGTAAIVMIGSENFLYGFIACAVICGLSLLFVCLSGEPVQLAQEARPAAKKTGNVLYILLSLFMIGLFWMLYELGNSGMFRLQMDLETQSGIHGISASFWQIWNPAFVVFLGIAFSIIWSFVRFNSFTKIAIGFIAAAIGFGLAAVSRGQGTEMLMLTFIVSTFFLSVAEIFSAAILSSTLIRFSNPKYLALMISISFLPSALVNYLLSHLFGLMNEWPYAQIAIAAAVYAVIGVLFFVLSRFLVPKKEKEEVMAQGYTKT